MEVEAEGVATSERVHVRRLDVADTFRWAWGVLADHRELVALTFVVQLLAVVGATGVTQPSSSAVEAPEISAVGEPSEAADAADAVEAPPSPEVADWVWPVSVAYLLGLGVVWGVCYLTAANAVAERKQSFRGRVAVAAKRLPALAGVTLLLSALVSVGLVALVIPGVYLLFRLALAYPACVVDRRGPVASVRGGWHAARGNVWKILGATLVYGVLVGTLGAVSGAFGEAYSLPNAGVRAVVSSVLVPLFGLAVGHLYLEGSRNV
ncbi:hypothetical protein [Halorussus amylolyticus]|uniref:hypothetical protein n=1 Tax=Halorussus amylolyticus TaxID=1126242 RepID=UPI00138F45B7|nr:hypothetical protein [Halorussus amylolyticus]